MLKAENLPPSCAVVTKSGNLKSWKTLGPSGRVMGLLYLYPLDALISQIYFWNKILHVSDSSSVHHQEFFTVRTAMVNVIQVLLTACEQDQDGPV